MKPTISTKQASAIKEGVRRGLTATVIADAVGCSESTVHRYKPYSLWAFRRGRTPESQEIIQRLRSRITLLRRVV